MIGETARERAGTRDLMSFIDNCYAAQLGYLRHSSPKLKKYVDQIPGAAEAYRVGNDRAIAELEEFVSEGPFLAGERVTIADCAFFSLVQYSDVLHGIKLPDNCIKLKAFYDFFGSRHSARMGSDLPEAWK
jgi:glutathione S-transferase